MKATINDSRLRSINREAVAGSDADWTRWNPWRAPGSAPVYDPCGATRASAVPQRAGLPQVAQQLASRTDASIEALGRQE